MGIDSLSERTKGNVTGNRWRVGTAVLRIRMAGGVGGGS